MRVLRTIFASLLFIASPVFSQTNLTFLVKDKSTNQPVTFCAVIVQGLKANSQSNDFGIVKINVEQNDTLIIYQLGYQRLKLPVAEIAASNYTVYLTPKNVLLDEVKVVYKRVDTFMAKNNTTFLDFEFYNDDILAMTNKGGKKNTLVLLDINGNQIAEKKLTVESEDLFRDCFGNIHILTTDSVYQVYYNYKELVIFPAYHINSYTSLLKPCECHHGPKLIFRLTSYKSLKNNYVMFDSRNSDRTDIACVADSVAIKGFNLDFDIKYFLAARRRGQGYLTSVDEITKHIDQLREEIDLPFEYQNLLRPVRSEMLKADSSFILMDYTNKAVHHFNLRGKKSGEFKMPEIQGWSEKLYADSDTRKFYFVSPQQGKLKIILYDPKTNKLTHSTEITGFSYIPHFVFHDGELFFLYRSTSNGFARKIMRYKLNWSKM